MEESLALPSESNWESVCAKSLVISPIALVMVKIIGLLTSLAVTGTGRVWRHSTDLSKSTAFLSNSAVSLSFFKESLPGDDFGEPDFGVVVSEFLRDDDLSDGILGADFPVSGFSDLCFSSDLAISSFEHFAADSFEEDSFAAIHVASKFSSGDFTELFQECLAESFFERGFVVSFVELDFAKSFFDSDFAESLLDICFVVSFVESDFAESFDNNFSESFFDNDFAESFLDNDFAEFFLDDFAESFLDSDSLESCSDAGFAEFLSGADFSETFPSLDLVLFFVGNDSVESVFPGDFVKRNTSFIYSWTFMWYIH